MKELKLNEFLYRADDFIKNAAIGDEHYSIQTKSGKAIIISEDEWKKLADGARDEIGGTILKSCD